MKKFIKLLNEKRWMFGGVVCLVLASMIFAMASGMGVQASITVGETTIQSNDEGVYLISTVNELTALGNASTDQTKGRTFRLVNDITVSSVTTPATGTFAGTFDGNGHVITYQDIAIEVTDTEATSDSKVHGLLFGTIQPGSTTVSGTNTIGKGGVVENLIINIKDTNASYLRKSKNGVIETTQNLVFEELQNPLIPLGETVSGLDDDSSKADAVHEALNAADITITKPNGDDVFVQNLRENGSQTTIYTAQEIGNDYFGLICGNNQGTVQQVLVTGNDVTVSREEMEVQNYSQLVQSGYREETYSYKQEIVAESGSVESETLSLDGNAYITEKVYSENFANDELKLNVSAPKEAARGSEITYTVTILNNNETSAYQNVTLSAGKTGKWSIDSAETNTGENETVEVGTIEAKESKIVTFSYDTNGESGNVSMSFSFSGSNGESAMQETKSVNGTLNAVITNLVDTSEMMELNGSTTGLDMSVSVPKAIVKGQPVTYIINVTNTSDEDYARVELTSSESGTWEDNDVPILKRGTKTITFSYIPNEEKDVEFTTGGAATLSGNTILKPVPTITAKCDAVNLIDSSTTNSEHSIAGLGVTISAPIADENENSEKTLAYSITLTNKSGRDYTNVQIQTSKAGSWKPWSYSDTGTMKKVGAIKRGATSSVTFNLAASDDTVLNFAVTGECNGGTKTSSNISANFLDISTDFYETGEKTVSTEFDNGLSATLTIENQGITKSGNWNYTLTMENTNEEPSGAIISRDIAINTDLSGWKTDDTETTADGFELTSNQIIPAGKKVVMKKVVTPAFAESNKVSVTNTQSIELQATLTTKAYTYKNVSNSNTMFSAFVSDGSGIESEEPLVSGNSLYAGGIAGKSAGTIKEIKQELSLSGSEIQGEFELGDIAGEAQNVASNWSDIILSGSEDYYGKGEGQPKQDDANWASVSKYDVDEGIISLSTAQDLKWLVKDAEFTYSTPAEGIVTASMQSQTFTRGLEYAIAYNARTSMDDTSQDTIYLSTTDGKLNLAASGYYRLLNAYATDGYYHYVTEPVGLEGAAFKYPYNNDEPFGIGTTNNDQIITRASNNPLEDVAQITLNNKGISGRIYYNVNSADSVPTSEGELKELLEGVVQLPFDAEEAIYNIVPVIDNYIYPMLQTRKFNQSDKAPIPKPEVTCYNYYDVDGNKNDYIAFVPSSGTKESTYEAGSDMLIQPAADTTNAGSYTFRYLFTTEHDSSKWDGNQRYIGTVEERNALMSTASEYTDSAVIPAALSGKKNVYLYVEVSKKSYTTEVYCFGPFAVTVADKLSTKINGQSSDLYNILDGDLLEITGAPENASIQIMISQGPEMKFSGNVYPVSGVTMRQNAGGYVYARIKYSDSKYGPVQLFDYTFGDACADPRVTPNTGLSSGGDVAAATIGSTVSVTLSSRTPGAEIFYLVSSESQSVSMERIQDVPDGISDGTISSDGYKYFCVENRWYRTPFTVLKRYNTGFSISHDNKEAQLMYVSTIALADGYEPSTMLEYVYKVQSAQQVSNPEAAYETRYMPGGEGIEVASVSKDANISFLSLTPEATLCYAIGSGSEVPKDEIPEEGIKVEGNYGDNFVVRVLAKKTGMLDSDIITFVYEISDQEMVNAPTATPGTTADVPTTVIPGNKILLSTTTKEAVIFYTTDGSSPQLTENEDGSYSVAEEDKEITKQYDPSTGIVMPLDGSGYFSITAVAVKTGMAKSSEVHFTYNYPGTVLAPYANIDSGKVNLDAKVILKNLTEGAVIYYDVAYGKDVPAEPTLSSSVFHEEYPFVISQKTTIKAMAVKDGVKSTVATFTYDPMAQLDAPQPSIASGSVVSRGTVLELKVSNGANVYYTMDGSDPTDSANASVMSGGTLTLNGDAGGQITIKAYATAADKSQSKVVTFTYQFSRNTGGVTASIESGTLVSNGTKVNLMSDVTDAEIYYTTDGTSPIEDGEKGSIVEIDGTPGSSFTIKAVAIANGEAGTITTFIYRIKERPIAPTASPAGGILTVATNVSLNSGDADIYYTTDGTEPTKSSTLYSEPILINRTTTLKAIAVSKDGELSEVASYTYTAAAKAAKVTSSEKDGTVLEPGDVIRLSTATDGAVIYYSTDGTEPNIDNLDSMLIYNEKIEVYRSVTIHAVAYRDDLRLSNVATWNYIVDIIPAVEQKREEAEKLAEEGLQDTDASGIVRQNGQEKEAVTRTVREKEYQTALTYTSDALPATVKMVTEQKDIDAYTEKKVKGIFGDDSTILESYKIKVEKGSSSVQPKEEVEVMFQIPKGYEDAALSVALVGNDHNLTTLETRREADVLYAKTTKVGSYVIIGPERENENETTIPYLLILEVVAVVTMFVGIVFYVKEKVKKYFKKR